MKTRVILFTRLAPENEESAPRIVFARWGKSLELELPAQMGVEDFAQHHGLKRHSQFDHTVGEMGRRATLLEWVQPSQENTLALSDQRVLKLEWEPFRQTALALSDGTDRRFLQLAVQFLASGGQVDDSVVAADYDAEFIQSLQKTLSEQKPKN